MLLMSLNSENFIACFWENSGNVYVEIHITVAVGQNLKLNILLKFMENHNVFKCLNKLWKLHQTAVKISKFAIQIIW